MSPNQAIVSDNSIRFSPLAAAQPLAIRSCQEALDATRSKRACQMAVSVNACPPLVFLSLMCLPFFVCFVNFVVPPLRPFVPSAAPVDAREP